MILLKVWLAYAIWGVAIYSAVFLWAVRNRQFSELDRQRYIALSTDKLEDTESNENKKPAFADRYVWLFLIIMTLSMLGTVVILGLKAGRGV